MLPEVDVCCWLASIPIIPQLLCRAACAAAIIAGFKLKEPKLARLLLVLLPNPLRLLPNAWAPKPFPNRAVRSNCLLPCLGSAFEMWTLTPLIIRSSPQRDWATCERRKKKIDYVDASNTNKEGKKYFLHISYVTWSSANVTKAKARNGLGMNTSVTSPYCIKNCRRSSVVMSSVQRPTNTLRLLSGSSGPCCKEERRVH